MTWQEIVSIWLDVVKAPPTSTEAARLRGLVQKYGAANVESCISKYVVDTTSAGAQPAGAVMKATIRCLEHDIIPDEA